MNSACFVRKANVDAHRLVPAIRDRRQARVDGLAQAGDDVGQRIAEILVLAAPEAVPSHHHSAAKDVVDRVQRSQRVALGWSDQALEHGAALSVEIL